MPVQIKIGKFNNDVWYGWSFYNESVPSFKKSNSLRLVFGQFTASGQQRPIFRLIQLGRGEGNFGRCPKSICSGPEKYHGDVALQLDGLREERKWGKKQNHGYICRLFDMKASKGKWVDIVVNTNYSSGEDGYLKVWVNDKLKCDYSGPVVSLATLAAGKRPGHRRGIFSSYTKRWDKRMGETLKPTMVAYYDEFRMGSSREDVDVRYLERNGFQAKN